MLLAVFCFTVAVIPFPFTNMRIWSMVSAALAENTDDPSSTRALHFIRYFTIVSSVGRAWCGVWHGVGWGAVGGVLTPHQLDLGTLSSSRTSPPSSLPAPSPPPQLTWNLFPITYFTSIDGWLPVDVIEPLWAALDW